MGRPVVEYQHGPLAEAAYAVASANRIKNIFFVIIGEFSLCLFLSVIYHLVVLETLLGEDEVAVCYAAAPEAGYLDGCLYHSEFDSHTYGVEVD